MRLELSAEADADLTELLAHGVRTFGLKTGREYFLSFGKKFELLRERPFAGARARELRGDIRCLKHRQHRIFYRVNESRIFVVRILHHARDADRLIG